MGRTLSLHPMAQRTTLRPRIGVVAIGRSPEAGNLPAPYTMPMYKSTCANISPLDAQKNRAVAPLRVGDLAARLHLIDITDCRQVIAKFSNLH